MPPVGSRERTVPHSPAMQSHILRETLSIHRDRSIMGTTLERISQLSRDMNDNDEYILWIAEQYYSVINVIETSFITVNIITSAVNCHGADSSICFPKMKGKFADFLFYTTRVHDKVCLQCANGVKPLFCKIIHDVPTGRDGTIQNTENVLSSCKEVWNHIYCFL